MISQSYWNISEVKLLNSLESVMNSYFISTTQDFVPIYGEKNYFLYEKASCCHLYVLLYWNSLWKSHCEACEERRLVYVGTHVQRRDNSSNVYLIRCILARNSGNPLLDSNYDKNILKNVRYDWDFFNYPTNTCVFNLI